MQLQRPPARIWKGTELTLPYPAGWPRAPERFLGGSGCTRKGHAEHGVETGAPRHEPADQDTAEIRYSVEEGHPMAAYHPGKVYFREKYNMFWIVGGLKMIRSITFRFFMGQAAKPCLHFSLHSEQIWTSPAPASTDQGKTSKEPGCGGRHLQNVTPARPPK